MPADDDDARCPPSLIATRKGGSDPDRYVAPTDAERAALRDAIATLVRGGDGARARAAKSAANAGFELADVPEIEGAVLVREVASRRRGGGAYVVRDPARMPDTLVQAPHTFFDEGTLALACELFHRTGARALFIDTAHRYKAALPDAHGEHPADVAHNAASLFQAATEGALSASPAATVVQLHGFAKRPGSTVIVSSGEKRSDPLVARAAASLGRALGSGVKRYPDDAGELGATTNVQGAIVRQAGGRFLHVELDADLRRDLAGDASRRAAVLGAIAEALEGR